MNDREAWRRSIRRAVLIGAGLLALHAAIVGLVVVATR